MRKLYDLDDVYCVENARNTLIQETKNRLNIYNRKNIDIVELLETARKRIISWINRNYLNGEYDETDFKEDNSIMFDKTIKKCANLYNYFMHRRNYYKDVLRYSNSIDSYRINVCKEELEDSERILNELIVILENIKSSLLFVLKQNTPFDSIIFHKQDDGKVTIQDWLKPYLNNISFDSLSLRDTNIENYDFSGTKGININSYAIKDNTLENTILNGVNFNCYKDDNLYPIDPTEINITGADFTGSNGAIVTLENIDELPENCNLTDAKIIINSKEDIDKFNLNKFKNNLFIKQDSIINDEVIDIDFNNYFNYTGIIDKKQLKQINDSLKFDCDNNEDIRVENNKIISYLVARELSNIIDFGNLYEYFEVIKRANDYYKEHQDEYKEEVSKILNSDDPKQTSINNTKLTLTTLYNNIGSPFKDNTKYNADNNKLKLYGEHGVFTFDLLRLGLSKEELLLVLDGNKDIELDDSSKQIFINLFESIYNFVSEQETVNNNEYKSIDDALSLSNIFKSLSSYFSKEYKLRNYLTGILENIIFNNLEDNNKGYSYAIKNIK